MANRKKASRKNKTLLEKEKYTAELSSRQLVIGVCILIAFGLACFMLGVIVGRFDPVAPQPTAENEPTRTFKITNEPPKAATPKEPEPPQETLARKPKTSPSLNDPLSIDQLEELVVHRETKLAMLNERFGDPTVYKDPAVLEELQEQTEALERELAEVDAAWQERADSR